MMNNLFNAYRSVLTHKSWLASLLLVCSTNAVALGLGELTSRSELGERFTAQVEVLAPPAYGTSLSVRLASAEEYQKNGLIYPVGVKLKFLLVNEVGQPALIRISSAQPVNEPFLQLLLDVSYSGARVVKSFSVLLDPPHAGSTGSPSAPLVDTDPNMPSMAFEASQSAAPAAVVKPSAPPAVKPARVAVPHQQKVAAPKRASRPQLRASNETRMPDSASGMKLAISTELSTGLRISKMEPATAASGLSEDALQEELIVKNKTLQDLTQQIAEVQGMINHLKTPELASSAVGAAASAVAASPAVNAVSRVPALPVKITPVPVMETPLWQRPEVVGGLLLALLALGGGAYVWWRRREQHMDYPPSVFEDLDLAREEALQTETVNPFVDQSLAAAETKTSTVMVGDLSMKVPAYKAPVQSSNPEYDLIEQADIYLQFGHDKLAEEVLLEALLMNPNNVQIYLTLLDIYDTQNDAAKFANLALDLESRADIKIWERVCKMGKRLDPHNELYGLHFVMPADNAHNTHGAHIDHELGDLYDGSSHPPQS